MYFQCKTALQPIALTADFGAGFSTLGKYFLIWKGTYDKVRAPVSEMQKQSKKNL